MEQEQLKNIEKMLGQLLRLAKKEASEETFISPSKVFELFGWTEETLRKKRRTGEIKRYKKAPSGRKVRYSREELEDLFKLNGNH